MPTGKNAFKAIITGLFLAILPACAHEMLKFDFDGRNWKPAAQKHTEDYDMYEYVLDGQTLADWQELVTYQFMPGLQEMTTAKVFMNDFFERMKQISPALESSVLALSDDDAIFDWKIADNSKNRQYELDRVHLGKEGLHFLHYSNKNPNLSKSEKNKWLVIFKKAQIGGP